MDYLSRVLPIGQQRTLAAMVVESSTAHLDHVRSDRRQYSSALKRDQAARCEREVDGAAVLGVPCARIGAPLHYPHLTSPARQQNGKQ